MEKTVYIEDKDIILPPNQLIYVLPSDEYRVFMALLTLHNMTAKQRSGGILNVFNSLHKQLKMSEEDFNIAVQTLVDSRLIEVKECDDNSFNVKFVIEILDIYINLELKDCSSMPLIEKATNVKWRSSKVIKLYRKIKEDYSDEEISELIIILNKTKAQDRVVKQAQEMLSHSNK